MLQADYWEVHLIYSQIKEGQTAGLHLLSTAGTGHDGPFHSGVQAASGQGMRSTLSASTSAAWVDQKEEKS